MEKSYAQKQCKSYHDRWFKFCAARKISFKFYPSVNEILDFLTCLFKDGLHYSCMNTASSALSALVDYGQRNMTGSHSYINQFLVRCLCTLNSTSPIQQNLGCLCCFQLSQISASKWWFELIKQSTHTGTVVMPIALISAQRLQTLKMLESSTCF